MQTFKVKVEREISMQNISDILCGAFEGGSNYWYRIEKFNKPTNFDNTKQGDRQYRCLSYPVNVGGSVVISVPEDQDGKKYTLNLESIEKGLKVMSEKYPKHFSDFIDETGDATTSDVFLQCCLFGEIVYG